MLASVAGSYRRVAQRDAGRGEGNETDASASPSRLCETCGSSGTCMNPALRCPRCHATLCRRCFRPGCALDVSGTIVSLPVWLGRRAVCDTCSLDADREGQFRISYLHALSRGELARREEWSYFSDATPQVWIALDTEACAVTWKTLALERNRPKESGSVPLLSIAAVSAVSAADSNGRRGGSIPSAILGTSGPSSSPIVPVSTEARSVRLVDARGRQLLQVGFTDVRAARRWMDGLSEALTLARLPHSGIFRISAAAASQGRGVGSRGADDGISASSNGNPTKSLEAAARESRARGREELRAKVGQPGMAHTAAALLRLKEVQQREAGEQQQARGSVVSRSAGDLGAHSAAPQSEAMSVEEERAINADIDDAVDELVRRAGGTSTRPGGAGIPHRGGKVGGVGSEATSTRGITGNLEADRALNSALTNVRSFGALAAGWVSRAAMRLPVSSSGIVAAVATPPTAHRGVEGVVGRGTVHDQDTRAISNR